MIKVSWELIKSENSSDYDEYVYNFLFCNFVMFFNFGWSFIWYVLVLKCEVDLRIKGNYYDKWN